MLSDNYILYGSGGHAKVVLECLLSENKSVLGIFDDAHTFDTFKNIPVLCGYDFNKFQNSLLIVTIGNNKIRKQLSLKIRHKLGSTIFSKNIISPSVTISDGSMILQGAILNSDCFIGRHVIVNTGSIVEHDCLIEDFAHIAPGAVVCGNSKIGEGSLIGANSVIAPNITIGKWCQISAGSSVLKNIPDYSLVQGVPGQIIKTIE
ncbi:MAG: acetyltransferase [Opitutaceae bacterium]|nr:acetyltransferase [Cytophagales bacterium]